MVTKDPRFAPLTPEQTAREHGFYWVRDKNYKGEDEWRVQCWEHGYWTVCGNEEVWRLEPDEIGARLEPPD